MSLTRVCKYHASNIIRVLILLTLSFSGMDHGHVVSATAVGLVLRALSNQASQLLHQQYKNAASI